MSEVSKFFTNFQRETLLSVATLAPGKVLRYNSADQLADIQPLFLTADNDDNLYKQSIIEDAIVLDHCHPLEKGNVIFYMAAQRNLDNLDGSSFINPDSFDLLSSNDAVIVGRYKG